MPARKRTAAQRALDLDKLADMDAKGLSQLEMAEALGITQPQVSFDLKKLQDRWHRERGTWESDKERGLARIRYIERQAHQAWDRSCEDKEVNTAEKTSAGGEGGERSKTAKRREGQSGNPAFLSLLLECNRDRLDILRPVAKKATLDTLGALLDALPVDVAIEVRAILVGRTADRQQEPCVPERLAAPPSGEEGAGGLPG